jgi:hypothetical protein
VIILTTPALSPPQDDLESHFWEDPTVREDFKGVVRQVLSRVNTVNGLAYKDDATVLAWEVREARWDTRGACVERCSGSAGAGLMALLLL